MTKITLKTLRLVFLSAGLFLLAGVIRKIGVGAIWEHLVRLQWGFAAVFAISFLWVVTYTCAWKQILKAQGNAIGFWTLFRAKVAGETVNTIQPANFLGGDPMRIYLLRHASNVTCMTASVVMDRTVNSMAIVGVIFAGVLIAFFTVPGLPPEVAVGAPCFLVLTSGLILFFLARQRRGLFASILRLALRLRIAKGLAVKHLPKAMELDEKIIKLYEKSHKAFWEALGFHILGRLLGILEIYVIGSAFTDRFTLLIALFLATLSPIINMTFTFIPGALGIMEGAFSGALYLLGLDPAIGLTIQIVKRIRSTLWTGLGVGIISFSRAPRRDDYNKDPLRQPL